MNIRMLPICLLIPLLGADLTGQKLRRGVELAPVVVIGRSVRVLSHKDLMLHRIQIVKVLKGQPLLTMGDKKAATKLTVMQGKTLSDHARPAPAETRLYCLHPFRNQKNSVKLPQQLAPFFKMNGFPGTHPKLDKQLNKDPHLQLASILIDSEKGLAPRKTSGRLFELAISGDKRVRTEAAELLAEREPLQAYLNRIHQRTIVNKAVGETDDVAYKVALSSLAATRRTANLVNTLCISTRDTGDPRFLLCLGRITQYLHKEDAAQVLMPHVRKARGVVRDRLLLVLGATSTQSSLKALLAMRNLDKNNKAIEAALRQHGSKAALEAVTSRPAK